MARFKITYKMEWSERNKHILLHKFTGNTRQPTIVEANNYIRDHSRYEFNTIAVWAAGGFGEYWLDPEEEKTLVLCEYDDYDHHCPICGHERDMGGSKCPICFRPWEE